MAHKTFAEPSTVFGDDVSPFLSASNVAEVLGVTQAELAKLTGLARNTLAASKEGQGGSRKIDAALSPIVRIMTMVTEMTGDRNRAALWFKHHPIPGWGGKTAYDLVSSRKSDKVLDYLEAVRSGVYA